MWVYILKLIIALPMLGCCLWAFSKWYQNTQTFSPKQVRLSIEDCLRVSPKSTLQVIRVGDQYLLISVTDQHVTVLKEMTEAEAVPWSSRRLEHNLSVESHSADSVKGIFNFSSWLKPIKSSMNAQRDVRRDSNKMGKK